MPKLLDHEKFCENLKEITTFKIMDKRHFHPDGLFSEQIFGPLKNYTCQCGIYHGISRSGGTCAICGVDIVNSDDRRRRFAKIVLPIPVVNPIFYDLLVDIGGKDLKNALDDLMKNENSILFIDPEEGDYIVTTSDSVSGDVTIKWERLEAIQKLVWGLSEKLKEDVPEWNLIYENKEKLFLREVIVLPPDLRPAAKGVEKNNQIVDKINRYYVQLLTKKEIMSNTILDISRDKSLFYSYFKQLQYDVNELYNYIVGKLSKKEGLIRGNILGKRIDFSGRAVIIPDPTINIDECVLPYVMYLEMFKIHIAKKLIEVSKFKTLNEGIDFVDNCIEYHIPVLFKICQEMSKDEVCLLNRQPSLHRLSMLGFKIKLSLENVIKIHPLACAPFNADFDGDQMAVYVPISEGAKQEIIDKFLITKNFTNPSNNSLTTIPSQDIVFGIYMLTLNRFPNLQKKVEFKGEKINEGIKIFNSCLPKDFPLVKIVVGKKQLVIILNKIKEKYSFEIVAKTLDNIKRIGFKYSTLYGATMSLRLSRVEGSKELQDLLYEGEDISAQLRRVSSKDTERFLEEHFNYADMIESGARGSWDQVRQIVLTRGFISNFKGHIIPHPIRHSFLNGLTTKEFFDSTYGSRKGLLDVALNTGTSGYLSRKLIFCCVNIVLDPTVDDCGTEDFLNVFVTDKKKARMLIGKWIKSNKQLKLITEENYSTFEGKTIQVRSPIFCKNDKLCCKCYGELYKSINSRFVGVIAAQALGESNTQLILRTFHTSGVAVVKGHSEDMKQMDIVNDLAVVSKLLHQFKGETYETIVHKLYDVYNNIRSIHHVHFECIVAQLMWKGFYKWRLLKNRDKVAPEFHSVQTVPSYESWLLALAFSNPKRSIMKGIFYSGQYKGIMDKILKGEKIE